MDKLQQEIEQKRADVSDADKAVKAAEKRAAEARRTLELRKAELAAYERAAALRPEHAFRASPALSLVRPLIEDRGNRGGRQPGAISIKWRAVLGSMVKANDNRSMTVPEICLLAESAKLPHDPRGVRERIKKFVALGLMHDEGGSFRVTETAIKRFELSARDKAPVALAADALISSGS